MEGFTLGDIPTGGIFPKPVKHGLAVTRPGARENRETGVGLADGHLGVAFDDSLGDGVTGETGDVVDVELAHETLPNVVHCFEAHAHLSGDLFVGMAFGNQLEHFHFARTQAVALLLELPASLQRLLVATLEALGNGRTEKGVSILDFANGRGQNG